MNTFAEVIQWINGATMRFGDPAAVVCQLFFRWVDDLKAYRGDELVCGLLGGKLVVCLHPEIEPLPLEVLGDGAQIGEKGELEAFGAKKITEGVWSIEPSLNMPGVIHAFIVLHGLPRHAPWERLILLP